MNNAKPGRPRIGKPRSYVLDDRHRNTVQRWQDTYGLRSESEALRSILEWTENRSERSGSNGWPKHAPAG